jgi:hypothetical protein
MSPFVDQTANGHTAIADNPSNFKSIGSMTSGSGRSTVIGTDHVVTYPFKGYVSGRETRAFTLEAWWHPLGGGHQNILSHDGEDDGLWFDGARLKFSTIYADASESTASWELDRFEAMHVVGVHTSAKNSLYVNGQLVAEATISEEQNNAGYGLFGVDDELISEGVFAIDAPAVYAQPLTDSTIRQHFQYGRDVRTWADAVSTYGGDLWEPDASRMNIYRAESWSDDLELNLGMQNTVTINDGLRPILDELGDAQPGEWRAVINLESLDSEELQRASVSWAGSGTFTVQLTINGTDWLTLPNGSSVEFPSTEIEEAELRVQFDGTDADAVLRSISATFYTDSVLQGTTSSRIAEFKGDGWIFVGTNEPIEYNYDTGVAFIDGSVKLSADTTESPAPVRTIELWATFDATDQFTLFDMSTVADTEPYLRWTGSAWSKRGVADVYVDGQLIDTDTWVPQSNVSYAFTIVLSADINLEMTIGSPAAGPSDENGRVHRFAIYEQPLTVEQISRAYNSLFGIAELAIEDESELSIAEADPEYELYAFAWSFTGAG